MKKLVLSLTIIGIIALIWYLETQKLKQFDGQSEKIRAAVKEEKSKNYEVGKELSRPSGFINTLNNQPITISELVGHKVALIDFWTYSCINCQRTTPYLNSWWEKYKDQGLVIIGVHTPEFEFEKKYENVLAATQKFGIKYPVVLDNDYATWRAYENRYWPRKYLIDIDGYIVYDHIGEGAYEETEQKIQELLKERLAVIGEDGNVSEEKVNFRAPRVLDQQISPEVYFGSSRNNLLGNGIRGQVGDGEFTIPLIPPVNTLYLEGNWRIEEEYARNKTGGAKIMFRYRGQSVNIVAESDNGVKVKIIRDGQPVFSGIDTDKDGRVLIKGSQLYNIINDRYGEYLLEIIIESPGLRVYTFTFG